MKSILPGKAFAAILLYPLLQGCFFYWLGMGPDMPQFVWATGYFWFSAALAIAASDCIHFKALRWTLTASVFAFLLAGLSYFIRSQISGIGGWIAFELWMSFSFTWLSCIVAEAVTTPRKSAAIAAQS
jgi:hypothetical protein